jgi:UDP-galactopyranose mutase
MFVLPIEYAFPDQTYFLYYAGKENFTRLVEYKRFTQYKSPHTLIGMEIPSANGKHYPLPFKSEYERANKYLDMLPDGVFSIGRAGSYQYRVDIDDCIEQAMDVAKKVGKL